MPVTGLVFGFCSLSDIADGYLARRFGWTSRLGEVLDPLADKILLLSLYLAFWRVGLVPGWVTGVVAGRDLALMAAAIGAWAFTDLRRFPADGWGKASTFCQLMAAAAVLAEAPDWVRWAGFAAVGVVTPAAGLRYFWRGWRALRAAATDR